MLLDLCGPLAMDATRTMASAPFRPDAVRRGGVTCGETGFPAYLIAEALAQVACRAAQIQVPLAGRRYLPATTRALTIADHPPSSVAGGTLTATLRRMQPLPEFACRLMDGDGGTIAEATLIVAPAPNVQPQSDQEARS